MPVTTRLLLVLSAGTVHRFWSVISSTSALHNLHQQQQQQQQRFGRTFLSTRQSHTKSRRRLVSVMYGTKLVSPSAERNRGPIWQVVEEKIVPAILQIERPASCGPKILEIAAGAGVHTHYFCKQLLWSMKQQQQQQQSDNTNSTTTKKPLFEWYPTDTDPDCLSSIAAYVADDRELVESDVVQIPNLLTLCEDGIIGSETQKMTNNSSVTTSSSYSIETVKFDAMICINMIHIAPWTATIGLMKIASQKLLLPGRNSNSSSGGILYLYGPFKVNGTCCESNRHFDMSLRQRNNEWGVRDLEMVVHEAELNGLTVMEVIEMPANNLSVLFRKRAA